MLRAQAISLAFMAARVGAIRERLHTEAESISSDDIADYFGPLRSWLQTKRTISRTPTPWHNCPTGYDLLTQVLTRRPTIVDLYSEPKASFEGRHKISAKTFAGLAEAGAVIPDVYVRDERKWNLTGPEYGYLQDLLGKTARKSTSRLKAKRLKFLFSRGRVA